MSAWSWGRTQRSDDDTPDLEETTSGSGLDQELWNLLGFWGDMEASGRRRPGAVAGERRGAQAVSLTIDSTGGGVLG